MARDLRRGRRGKSGALPSEAVARIVAGVQGKADEARRRGGVRAIVDELIIHLLLDAGLKAVEVCRITVADARLGQGAGLWVRDRHGQVQRSVPLDNRVAALVRGYAELHREGAGGADPLLVSERGGPLGYMGVYNRVRRIGQQAGVSGLTAQALRGTFIVRQFDLHSDVLRVQRLAGHAHPKTTARHLSRTIQCDACGARVRVADTHRIDSGHRLCPACMRDIRQPRP